MTKKEQLKFIEDNYPLYNNHISNRRIRHTFFDTIEYKLICLDFMPLMAVLMRNAKP